jgi:hypothetical protein
LMLFSRESCSKDELRKSSGSKKSSAPAEVRIVHCGEVAGGVCSTLVGIVSLLFCQYCGHRGGSTTILELKFQVMLYHRRYRIVDTSCVEVGVVYCQLYLE